ncbi:GspE/PulE family protein [Derxia gummosa]|uniref:GspE/PulE family protein n=1 Tax=Derxia gummosa DSM 723 TaxID=1121388 RepID=A0A9U5FZQ3_9BURK|nr:ATPase, T2SS/T4P/T4SS family [Derxia gummosa]
MGAPDSNDRLAGLDTLDWPGLTGVSLAEGDPRACRLDMLRGSHVEGRLVRFAPGADTLLFEPDALGKPLAMKLALLRAVRLTTPLHAQPGRHLPPLRDYRVIYTDDTSEQGQVFATVDTAGGAFLYIASDDGLMRSFIPHASVLRWELDPRRAPLALAREDAAGAGRTPAPAAFPAAAGLGLVPRDAPTEDPTATVPGLQHTINLRIASADKLWREIDSQSTLPVMRIGDLLLEHGRITETDLAAALKRQKQQGGPLGRALLDLGAVDEDTLNAALGTKLGMPTVDLDAFPLDPAAALLVPAAVARRLRALPIAERNGLLVVAVDDPARGHVADELKFSTQRKVVTVLATPEALDAGLARGYRDPGDDDHGGMVEYEPGDVTALAERLAAEGVADGIEIEDVQVSESDNALTRLVNTMILDAHQQGVSDIHIETYPGKAKTRIRFRKDGDMQPYLELPATYRRAVIARIKIMASLDISERRKPQDGKIDFSRHAPVKLELRVATIPTNNGLEDVVMRLLASSKPVPLAKLGLSQRNRVEIEKIAQRPYGLFLVCGPTGSGKTTTLHSCLAHMNTPDRKIWTAEDPVEITQAGLRQVQVNPKIGWTFADALRAFLRADPDVIMIGEMRDQETSRIAVEASLTGHLVLSTLHTNSAAESVVRLLDMGLDPFNFADALLGVLAQRLVRRLCEKCREPHELDGDEINALLDEYSTQIPEAARPSRDEMLRKGIAMFGNERGRLQLWHAPGCKHCGGTGYKGRAGIHELLVADRAVKRLIQTGGRVEQILDAGVGAGMRTLRQDGIQKALMGVTDMHEVRAASNL